jgi:plasmid stability protein
MAITLTVRDVPAALHDRLQRRAEAHRRSLDREVIALLKEAVEQTSEDKRQAAIERIKRRRENGPVIHDSPAEVKHKTREGLASEDRQALLEWIDRLREEGPTIEERPEEMKRKMREGLL